MKNGPYLLKFTDFFISMRLFRKKKYCLLSLQEDLDYNSSDFSQIIEKNSGVGGVNCHRFAII